MTSVYVVTCFYNPSWGLRSPDNYDHFDKVMVAADKQSADALAEEYRKNSGKPYAYGIVKKHLIFE